MRATECAINSRLEGQRELWQDTVKSLSERIGKSIAPSPDDVVWLASMVGQLSLQVSNYQELRGRLLQERDSV